MKTKIIIINSLILIAVILNFALLDPSRTKNEFKLELSDLVPNKIGSWQSQDIQIDNYVLKAISADSQVWKNYHDGNGNITEVWVSFYEDQIKATAHNPNTCYDGQGWSTEKGKVSVALSDDIMLEMTRIFLMKGENKYLSYYFYIASGEPAGTEFVKNLYKLYYGFVKQRSDLLFLRFSIDLKNGDVNEKEEKLKNFIKSFYFSFKKEMPANFFS
jgi:EpsI family protein